MRLDNIDQVIGFLSILHVPFMEDKEVLLLLDDAVELTKKQKALLSEALDALVDENIELCGYLQRDPEEEKRCESCPYSSLQRECWMRYLEMRLREKEECQTEKK